MADILVEFHLRSFGTLSIACQSSTKRFTDWFDFADWLKQENEHNHTVCITSWTYVHAVRKGEK